jgi:hypothetical protein
MLDRALQIAARQMLERDARSLAFLDEVRAAPRSR